MDLLKQLEELIEIIPRDLLELSPSEFAEQKVKLSSAVSTLKTGKFSYKLTPYLREVVDTLDPYHPAKVIAVMKGAQIGFTQGVIVNGILWTIANNPGNILALSANDQLSREMVESRLDPAIQSAGLQDLIRPNTIRKRNQRTGDTSNYKEFAGGRLFAGGLQSINKLGKQRSIKTGFFDDWDAAPLADKEQGNIFDLIQQRFSTAANSGKQFYISTPETRPSNIEKIYEMGDQRKWKVPCPKCGTFIEILWNETINGEKVGIVFEKDDDGHLIEKSVGYVCQECGQFFKEKHKYTMNLHGVWTPTAEPARPGYYSYHIPCFVAAPGMYNWTHYAYQWADIFKDGITNKSKLKVFCNVVKGEPWQEATEKIAQNQLAQNTRDYPIGLVPNDLSEKDGNGRIILLTCACDLNGLEDDGRLDYEIVAHSESGSTYSVDQGSIGSFKRGKQSDEGRIKLSYRNNQEGNVWDPFLEIIQKDYETDDGSTMKILLTGIDTGYFTTYAYKFIDDHPEITVGLKGKVVDRFQKVNRDIGEFKQSLERSNLYVVEVDKVKDRLAEDINKPLKTPQIPGFMNFPQPAKGKYTTPGFFVQFEAEEKKLEENESGDVIGWKWVKKNAHAQNHFFDTRVYNLVLRDIVAKNACKAYKLKEWNWNIFVNIVKSIID